VEAGHAKPSRSLSVFLNSAEYSDIAEIGKGRRGDLFQVFSESDTRKAYFE
jgi:hypothetical protein